ncbi:hypothetical protein I5J62_24375 [Pseudomonas aeruginosa]|uniref:hypothetical protein n=1 Tax=Pseudomonas aeruginosa TaxID=287 RepID=UPI001A357AEF|nr:hypothetical protein [Pseudomonas aeruginosa]MBG7512583.1 hypothetical protein [Pseudomonas aeruginosa]MBH4002553.1 hypothetical protein [Pseudomonas aeruginosa]MBH9508838.1 hypothetical protein [Pseudomonas aeruginosa]
MSKDESPAAFPLGANEYGGHGSQAGMTLRDYLAAKAMQGFLEDPDFGNSFEKTARHAYEMADAMLAARDD